MKNTRSIMKIAAALLLMVAVMGQMGSPASAKQIITGAPTINPYLCQVESPNPGGISVLNAVAAPRFGTIAQSLWAVGYYSHPQSFTPQANTLAMRYDGLKWTVVNTPNVGSENYLTAVAANTQTDAWAVGYSVTNGVERPLIMRYTGVYWKLVAVFPTPSDPTSTKSYARFTGVTTLGAGEVIAVGYSTNASGFQVPLAMRYNGKSWTKMDVPVLGISGKLLGITADGTDVWAVGSAVDINSGEYAILYHFNGGTWSAIGKGSGYLTSVTVSSAGVFAVGDITGKSGKETLAMMYNPTSGSFARVPSLNLDIDHNFLTSVTASGKEIYAVGYAGLPNSDTEVVPLVLRYDGQAFTSIKAPHPTTVDKLASVIVSSDTLWTVGSSAKSDLNVKTLVLTTACGAAR